MQLILLVIIFLFINKEDALCEKNIIHTVMKEVIGQIDENSVFIGENCTKNFLLSEEFDLKDFKIVNQPLFEEGISFGKKNTGIRIDLSFLTEDYNYEIISKPEAIDLGDKEIYLIIYSPILSEDGRFAIIQYSYGCGLLCGNLEQLILKKNLENDDWIVIARFAHELV